MRKIKKSAVVAMALFFSMTMIPTNVDAASKKLKVNTVYNMTTKVKGKTKKRYKVKLKVGKKTYTAKKTSLTVKKLKKGKKVTIKISAQGPKAKYKASAWASKKVKIKK